MNRAPASPLSERAALASLPGDFPEHSLEIRARKPLPASGYRAEQLDLILQDCSPVRGILIGPEGVWNGLPAILYCHAHGNRYGIGADELMDGRPALLSPYAPQLAAAGFLALSIDMPCFGMRRGESEAASAKRHGWFGRTLFGEMLADLRAALTLLARMREVDAGRIGAFGLSMGATHAFWLAALDERIKAVAHLCTFADLETLIAAGGHDLHGAYMTVPGLLPDWTAGRIAGLIAPRPQLVGIGLEDPLTPVEAARIALAELRHAYVQAPEALMIIEEAQSGHMETPDMRDAVLALFRRTFVR